jgi:hypothetical protein
MQLRKHIYDFCKKAHSKLTFLWQILQLLSIFLNTGVPLDNLLRPPRGARPSGWEPLLYGFMDAMTYRSFLITFEIVRNNLSSCLTLY